MFTCCTGASFLMVARDYRLQLAAKKLPAPLCGFKHTLSRQLSLISNAVSSNKSMAITIYAKEQCVLHMMMAGNTLVVSRATGDTLNNLKCTAETLVTKNFLDFVHCEDKALMSAAVQRLRHAEKSVRFECRYVSLQREIIWLDLVISRSRVQPAGVEMVVQKASGCDEGQSALVFGGE